MDGASVCEDLWPIGDMPKNLEQTRPPARPPARLAPEQGHQAWRAAERQANGNVTAKGLSHAARELRPRRHVPTLATPRPSWRSCCVMAPSRRGRRAKRSRPRSIVPQILVRKSCVFSRVVDPSRSCWRSPGAPRPSIVTRCHNAKTGSPNASHTKQKGRDVHHNATAGIFGTRAKCPLHNQVASNRKKTAASLEGGRGRINHSRLAGLSGALPSSRPRSEAHKPGDAG
jgi:hypothetical protein